MNKSLSLVFDRYSDTNKIYRNLLMWLAGLAVALASFPSFAQDQPDTPAGLQGTESLLNALAPQSETLRNHALTASQYPDVLKELADIQDQSRNAFQNELSRYGRKRQEWFYELSRYPDLIHTLATTPEGKSEGEINAIVRKPYPALREASWKIYKSHYHDLQKVDAIYQNAEGQYDKVIGSLDSFAQDAFDNLVKNPEVLSLLDDHLDITARLGEAYAADPEGTRDYLTGVHNQLDVEKTQDLETYKSELANNPDALNDLEKASDDYARSNGYNYTPYSQDEVVNYYNYNPYSYWFGYPYWYGNPMWYPGSYWGGLGFYYGYGGYPIVFGLPSWRFSSWFFGGAYRYYPSLYRQYGQYYRTMGYRGDVRRGYTNGFNSAAGRHFGARNDMGRTYGGRGSGFNTPNARGNYPTRGMNPGADARGYNGIPSVRGGFSSPNTRNFDSRGSYRENNQPPSSRSFGGNSRGYNAPGMGSGRSSGGSFGGAARGSFGGGSRGGSFNGGGSRGGGRGGR